MSLHGVCSQLEREAKAKTQKGKKKARRGSEEEEEEGEEFDGGAGDEDDDGVCDPSYDFTVF